MRGPKAQIARILSIFDLLEIKTDGLSITQIHDELSSRGHDASPGTLSRDLDVLIQAGFPLIAEVDDSGTSKNPNTLWRLSRTPRINPYLMLNARELFALFLARGALKPLENTPFYEDLQSIFGKLEEKLDFRQMEYLETREAELRFDPGPAWGLGLNPDILETLRAACNAGRILEGTYYSVNSKSENIRRLGPHYLYYANGGLYLVAEDLTRSASASGNTIPPVPGNDGKVKVFAVPRFRSAQMLPDPYEGKIVTPEEFFSGTLNVYNGSKPEKIVVEFDSDVAPHIRERRWHLSQQLTNLDRGRVRVTLELGLTPELTAWILGFGPSARVVSPATLAERVSAKAFATLSLYQKKSG